MCRIKDCQKGFTLVELMIVVVIIGILASIAVPKFVAVVTRAKLAELKQGLWFVIKLERAYYFANDRYEEFDFTDTESRPLVFLSRTVILFIALPSLRKLRREKKTVAITILTLMKTAMTVCRQPLAESRIF